MSERLRTFVCQTKAVLHVRSALQLILQAPGARDRNYQARDARGVAHGWLGSLSRLLADAEALQIHEHKAHLLFSWVQKLLALCRR